MTKSPFSSTCSSLQQKVAQTHSKPFSIFFFRFATFSKQGSADQRIKRVLEAEINRLQESGDFGRVGLTGVANAPSYSEKNWGGSFPRKRYWSVYASTSTIALGSIGTWTGTVDWEVTQWGYWQMSVDNNTQEFEATSKEPGAPLRAPTIEAGLAPACKDTCYGDLRLQMWEKKSDGGKGQMILDVTSDMAALEIGGGPWFNAWKGSSTSPQLLGQTLRVPVDVEGFFSLAPFLKPPGL